jgi:hypothetical protein
MTSQHPHDPFRPVATEDAAPAAETPEPTPEPEPEPEQAKGKRGRRRSTAPKDEGALTGDAAPAAEDELAAALAELDEGGSKE